MDFLASPIFEGSDSTLTLITVWALRFGVTTPGDRLLVTNDALGRTIHPTPVLGELLLTTACTGT